MTWEQRKGGGSTWRLWSERTLHDCCESTASSVRSRMPPTCVQAQSAQRGALSWKGGGHAFSVQSAGAVAPTLPRPCGAALIDRKE